MTSPAFQPSLFSLQAAIGDTIPITSGAYSGIRRTPSPAVILSEAKDLRLGSETTPGICRHCLCTGDSCKTSSGDRCDWLDETHTCCNAEVCRNKQARLVAKSLPAAKSIVRKPSQKSNPRRPVFRGNRVDRAFQRWYCS